jgi:PIN domain nuclease of toxin-antitoxin system
VSIGPGYLLDTQVLLWLDHKPERIAGSVYELISDPGTTVYLSSASIWEAVLKMSLKKLHLNTPILELMNRARLVELHVTSRYMNAVAQLPFHHKDPFDRMLIAQAQVESLILVTSDTQMLPYDVAIISV